MSIPRTPLVERFWPTPMSDLRALLEKALGLPPYLLAWRLTLPPSLASTATSKETPMSEPVTARKSKTFLVTIHDDSWDGSELLHLFDGKAVEVTIHEAEPVSPKADMERIARAVKRADATRLMRYGDPDAAV